MLDKSKIYAAYTKPISQFNDQPPVKRFKRVKILFEDGISFYVESLTSKDSRGFGRRYSVKKYCFYLKEIKPKPVHNICPFCEAGMVSKVYVSPPLVNANTIRILFSRSDLVIKDGKVVKNQFGPTGRVAEKGDYERANFVIEHSRVFQNWKF